ncbi:MAG TPA: serine/threonine-protein kinase [Blastocatellia bacterium]|jgi:serine/threonine-protein kinase|nr:serine/threonine-protein kinase [Blastocatellia bacterium]
MIGNTVGTYKITEKIGEGGMGAVFKGVDLMLEREVAIKMLRPELASQPQVVERFRSEAVTLAKLNHPNIATLYSFLRQGNDFFMVMEFVRGQTLDDAIRQYGAMAWDRALGLFCQALEGIDHAHRLGIIHRDIKPANMMLTETGSIKVMDFGIARVLGSARLTRQGNIVGTIEYMSPEQVRGEEADARSDIYSLGILLYEMLTGRVPFESQSEFELMKAQIEQAPTPPRTFAAHLPLPIEQAIMRSLAKKPTARFQTAGEFRAVLLGALAGAAAPLENTPRVAYAAPATRFNEPAPAKTSPQEGQARSASGEMPKETRLAGGSGAAPYANFDQTLNQMKDTRLGSFDTHPAAGQQTSGQGYPANAQPSLLSKLNWKHYAGAGALVLGLILAPLAFMGGGAKETPSQPSTVTQQPAPPQAPPAVQSAPPPTAPAPSVTENALPAGVEPVNKQAGEASDSNKPARSRAGRAERGAETPVASEPERRSPPPPQPTPAPRKEEKPVVAQEPEKKDEKKIEKKIEKVGGLFNKVKGIFGGGDKKKKDEKKP